MATASYHPSTSSSLSNHRLVWVDGTINESAEDCQQTSRQLRSVVKDLTLFNDPNKCEQFLHRVTDQKVFVVTSGSLAQGLVPRIHELTQVDVIYIFCGNRTRHEQWSRQWPKVEGIFTQIQPICDALAQSTGQSDDDAIPMSFVVFNEGASSVDLDQLEPSFMYTQLFKSILLNMRHKTKAVPELTAYYRPSVIDNEKELVVLKEFRGNYRPEDAIRWYTRECFLYQALNKALILLNAEVIVKMGFFIQHLHRQIERLHEEQVRGYNGQPITLYRGQSLTALAFSKAKRSRGGLMSFNNFLSTSTNKEVALDFARKRTDKDSIPVVFVMTVDPAIISTPFAKVSRLSYFKKENEILFSMHSVFRINRIRAIDEIGRVVEIHMTLTAESDPQLRELTDRLENEISGRTGWERIGELLIRLGHLDQAEKLYLELIRQAVNADDRALYNHCLGRIKSKQRDYEAALHYCKTSLGIRLRTAREGDPSVAACYTSIAMVYHHKEDKNQALEYYEKALGIYRQNFGENHPTLADCYSNIASVYNSMTLHKTALEFYAKALTIYQATLPDNHHNVATCYNSNGLLYKDLGDYPRALSFLRYALGIRERTLPANHFSLATSCNNIGSVYFATREYAKALPFFERALAINQAIFKPDHSAILDTRRWIAAVKKKAM